MFFLPWVTRWVSYKEINWVHRRFSVMSVVLFSFFVCLFLFHFVCVCIWFLCCVCVFLFWFFVLVVSELSIHECSFIFSNVYIIGFDFNFSNISSTLFPHWIYFVSYVDFLYVCFILPSLNRNSIKFLGYIFFWNYCEWCHIESWTF